MNTKKVFAVGINSDDSSAIMQPGEYLNALNVRLFPARDGKFAEVTNIEGNVMKTVTLPGGANRCIGSVEDRVNSRVLFFNYNPEGNHGIYCYDSRVDLVYTVMLSADVQGGFGFNGDINSAVVVGDLLYWTDNVAPRKLNIEAGIKRYHPSYQTSVAAYPASISQSVISLIRNQPAYPLSVEKQTDSNYPNNLVGNEAFQFMYRFVYRDNEVSTFSHWSNLVNYNNTIGSPAETFNKISVKVPFSQKIDSDVTAIEFAVRYALGGNVFIVKTITSGFSAHNAETPGQQIGFDFYNDVIGVAVDAATSTKQFDSVPVKSGTLEVARSRLFLGDNTEGYDTPTVTSMTASAIKSSSASLIGLIWRFDYLSGGLPAVPKYLIKLSGVGANNGYYEYFGAFPPSPLSVSWNDIKNNFRGLSEVNVFASFGFSVPYSDITGFKSTGVSVTITSFDGSITSLAGVVGFKSASSYRVGLVFYDDAGRKSGVVEAAKIDTEDRKYSSSVFTTSIDWVLSNQNAVNQIPVWAKYYAPVITQSLRTNFFAQVRTSEVAYISKNAAGEYQTPVNTYDDTRFGIAIKIDQLSKYGMGYQYQEGDLIKLYKNDDSSPAVLKVKDQWGEYIIADLVNLGTIGSYLFEVYSPYQQSSSEFYYEQGFKYAINNPGLPQRTFSVVSGVFLGDVIYVDRSISSTQYLVEAMSPNDLYWKNWNLNLGRVNQILSIGQVRKKTSVSYSNVFVSGTKTNGLSSFEPLSQTNLPYELGVIQKLHLVSKVEAEGTVMLAIGETETASMYLGEAQIFDNTGESILATSSGVIGNVNVLRGSYGTINPESVVNAFGTVYFFDANRGSVVQYASNGLFPISGNKMHRHWRRVGEDVLANRSLKVYGGQDPYNEEILMFAPARTVKPQNEVLQDMILSTSSYQFNYVGGSGNLTVILTPGELYSVSVNNGAALTYNGETITDSFYAVAGVNTIGVVSDSPGTLTLNRILQSMYSTYDGFGGVWVYTPSMDRWTSKYSFRPDRMDIVSNRLITFKSGVPYLHNSSLRNTFYGNAYPSQIGCVHNEVGGSIKKYQNFSVEGDTPDLVHLRAEVPNVSSTDLRKAAVDPSDPRKLGDFTVKEGISYATFYRDRLSPNVSGSYDEKMMKGDMVTADFGLLQVAYFGQAKKYFRALNIGFVPSAGHIQITQQNA